MAMTEKLSNGMLAAPGLSAFELIDGHIYEHQPLLYHR